MILDNQKKLIFLSLTLTIKDITLLEISSFILNLEEENLDLVKIVRRFFFIIYKKKKFLLTLYKTFIYKIRGKNSYFEFNKNTATGGIFKKKMWDKKYKYKNIMSFTENANNDIEFYKFFLLPNGLIRRRITKWNGYCYRNYKTVRNIVYQRIFVWPYLITIKPKIIIIHNIFFLSYFTLTKKKNSNCFGFLRTWHSKIRRWRRNVGLKILNTLYNRYFFFYNNSYIRVFNLHYDLNFLNFFQVKKKTIKKLYLTNYKYYNQIKRRNWKFSKKFSIFYKRLLKKGYFIGYTFFLRFYCIYFFWYLFFYNKFYFFYNRILFNLWIRFFSIINLLVDLSNKFFYSFNLLYSNLQYFYTSLHYFEFENILNYYIKKVFNFYYVINNNKLIIQKYIQCYNQYIFIIFFNFFNWYNNYNLYYNNLLWYPQILNKLPKNEKMFFDFYYKSNYKCKVLYNIDFFRITKFKSKLKSYKKKNNLQIIKKNTNILLL